MDCLNCRVLTTRIEAARKRLGDLKGVHAQWYMRKDTRPEDEIIRDMENIAYSAILYLNGTPGPYLKEKT